MSLDWENSKNSIIWFSRLRIFWKYPPTFEQNYSSFVSFQDWVTLSCFFASLFLYHICQFVIEFNRYNSWVDCRKHCDFSSKTIHPATSFIFFLYYLKILGIKNLSFSKTMKGYFHLFLDFILGYSPKTSKIIQF